MCLNPNWLFSYTKVQGIGPVLTWVNTNLQAELCHPSTKTNKNYKADLKSEAYPYTSARENCNL